MQLLAKQRLQLLAEDNPQKERINDELDNKREHVKQLKKSMPSRQNRMSVSPTQRNQTQKEINHTKEQMSDLRLRKSQIGD